MSYSAHFRVAEQLRREIAGTYTAVGHTVNDLLVSKFPITLQTLVFMTTLRFSPDQNPKEVALRVEIPGGETRRTETRKVGRIPDEARHDPDFPFLEARGDWILRKIKLPSSGRMKVYLEVDGEDVLAGVLPVTRRPDPSKEVPEEVTLLHQLIRIGTPEAREAFDFFMQNFDEMIVSQPSEGFFESFVLTLRAGEDENEIVCFVTRPVHDWRAAIKFRGLDDDIVPEIILARTYHCVFRFPPNSLDDSKLRPIRVDHHSK